MSNQGVAEVDLLRAGSGAAGQEVEVLHGQPDLHLGVGPDDDLLRPFQPLVGDLGLILGVEVHFPVGVHAQPYGPVHPITSEN